MPAEQRDTAPHSMTAASIAACGGVSPDTRRKWTMRTTPLVRSGPQFTPHDAIETAIVAALANANHKRAPDAWLSVRNDVRQHILGGSDELWIVMSAQSSFAQAARTASEVVRTASLDGGPVYVVSLIKVIADARRRFDAEVARVARKSPTAAAKVRRMQA
jgi:hypothetical protein